MTINHSSLRFHSSISLICSYGEASENSSSCLLPLHTFRMKSYNYFEQLPVHD